MHTLQLPPQQSLWPIGIAGVLMLAVAINMMMVYIAVSHPSLPVTTAQQPDKKGP